MLYSHFAGALARLSVRVKCEYDIISYLPMPLHLIINLAVLVNRVGMALIHSHHLGISIDGFYAFVLKKTYHVRHMFHERP